MIAVPTLRHKEHGTAVEVSDEEAKIMGPQWTSSPTSDGDPDPSTAHVMSSEPPPKGGKGSSDAAWTTYARSHNVAVADEMTRKEVIAACEAAGVRVE